MYWIFAIGGYVGGLPDRVLRVPDRLPRRLRRAVPRGEGARAGAPRARRAREPGDRREGGHRRRLPRPRAPHRRAGAAPMRIAMGDPRRALDRRRRHPDPRHHRRARALPRGHVRGLAVFHIVPSDGSAYLGLLVGGADLDRRDRARLLLLRRAPRRDRPAALAACEGVHDFLKNKWYFDEMIDALVYRPVIRIGRFANNVVERVVVAGDRRRHDRRRPRARPPRPRAPSRASSAPTRCSSSAASPRSPSTSWW